MVTLEPCTAEDLSVEDIRNGWWLSVSLNGHNTYEIKAIKVLLARIAELERNNVIYSPCQKHIGTAWLMIDRLDPPKHKLVCPICEPPDSPPSKL